MFDHVTIRASDRSASERFYTTVLAALGIAVAARDDEFTQFGGFSVAQATADRPVTRRLHIGFGAASREAVDAFWQAGVDAGYVSDGAPGERPQYTPQYYGGFLLDPDGNSAEAVHHEDVRRDGVVDHLWFRVADLAASRAFYLAVAPHAGLRLGTDTAERVSFDRGRGGGTFSVVAGDAPTEHLHLAFSASGRGAVDDFYDAAVEAGYRDNGAPGERPQDHPGPSGAFVLDPDGNSVELVDHGARA